MNFSALRAGIKKGEGGIGLYLFYHEEGIILPSIKLLPFAEGFKGKALIEMNRRMVGDADFKETRSDFLLFTVLDIKGHQLLADPPIPVLGMNADIEEFRFVINISEANITG